MSVLKLQDRTPKVLTLTALNAVKQGALDQSRVAGLTHQFYRYPARFSPAFVSSAIECFSSPGDVVLDPYMGGGTTIVEAFARGRVGIGNDLNSLAVFITRAKTTQLSDSEKQVVVEWISKEIPALSYHTVTDEVADLVCPLRTRNLNLPRARPVKKLLALALLSLRSLPSTATQNFVRCVLLNVAQWALNNRKAAPTLPMVREKIKKSAFEMLDGLTEMSAAISQQGFSPSAPQLIHGTAADLPHSQPFSDGCKANLVVTSPPYPGIHILYHRWQVDGRKETPAPYWIADCKDGKGTSFYNFADRSPEGMENYFEESLRTLNSIRKVMAHGAIIAQMIAFSKPRNQLPRYLRNMELAGFEEIRELQDEGNERAFKRIWRPVPSRKWYANLKGNTCSSREVVLLHRAL